MMDEFKSPKMLIIDHYDSMIRQLDIFTEELIEKSDEKDLVDLLPKDDENMTGLDGVTPGTTRFRDYLELVRSKSIEELKKAQQETLDSYEMNKSLYKYDRETLTDEKVEEMRKNLFKDKFCFLLHFGYDNRTKCALKYATIITNFYLDENDLDLLK